MRKLLTLGLASLFLVVTGCQDTNTTGPLAGPDFHKGHGAGHPGRGSDRANPAHHDNEFAMLDDFATETTGATGSGKARVGSSVEVEVEAKGLIPGHEYELNVTIGPQPDGFTSFVTFGPLIADEDGEVEFEEDLDLLSLLGPGTYRLDFFVTHTHPTIPDPLFGLLDRDLLLRCAPFITVTV